MKKPTATGKEPNVVDPKEWARARAELLAAEKAATRAQDAVAAQRRRLPMVRFRSDYAFVTPRGTVSLLDLFGENSQLLIYQFMDTGPKHICPGIRICTWSSSTGLITKTAPNSCGTNSVTCERARSVRS
ncbi:DUF899 family protein [Sorangium sp. So ce1078]|uniref:DUF899 family protein n=1 Tax=Sorangium sp. So ce1078 TaxID=3133329 RepID=UPI003F6082FC